MVRDDKLGVSANIALDSSVEVLLDTLNMSVNVFHSGCKDVGFDYNTFPFVPMGNLPSVPFAVDMSISP